MTTENENIESESPIGVTLLDKYLFELGVVDLTRPYKRPQIFLAKPDKTIIAKLSESYNKVQNLKLGNISDFRLHIPIEVEDGLTHELIINPHCEILRERYLVKVVLGDITEWYRIERINKGMDDEKDYMIAHLFSLGIELNDKTINKYSVVSYNLTQMISGKLAESMPGILSETNWTVGYVDADFDLKYRSLAIDKKTVLDSVFQVAQTFNALIVWDTENREIDFYKPENIGINRGLKLSYGHYLKTLDREANADEMVTKLKVFGKDDLSIQSVNPTGTNYIEDFTYFLYPFTRDESGTVLTSSYYMSDSLCGAILDYVDLVDANTGTFETLLASKEAYEAELATATTALYTLENELVIIEDNIYVAQTTDTDDSALQLQKTAKEAEITAKELEIDAINANIDLVDVDIDALRVTLSVTGNFTAEQIIERNQFIVERSWIDTNHINADELYEDALEKFEEYSTPKTIIKIDIVNFMDVVEEQLNWDKLNLGDTVTIKYEKLDISVSAKIIEIEIDYENNNINLVIANVKELMTDEEKLIRDLYKAVSTSTSIDMNKFRWENNEEDLGEVNAIINQMFDDIKNQIDMTLNDTVIIGRTGITIIDPADSLRLIRLTHGAIGLSLDAGNNYQTAISASGVVAERLFGKIIAGVNLTIENTAGTFEVDANGVTITNMDLTLTRSDDLFRIYMNATDGIKLQQGDGNPLWTSPTDLLWADITTGDLHAQNIHINLDGDNNISITPDDGIIINRSSLNRIWLDIDDGIKIQKNESGSWVSKLYLDMNGNLVITGNITMDGGSINWTTVNNPPGSGGADLPDYIKPTYIDGAMVWSSELHGGELYIYDVGSGTYDPTEPFNPASIPYDKKIHIGEVATGKWGMRVFGETEKDMLMFDEYGINPSFIKRYPNKVWNSGFEWYGEDNTPLYWTGDGVVTADSNWEGTVALILQSGETMEQGVEENNENVGADPAWWGNIQTRVSFYLIGGDITSTCRVRVKKYSDNSSYTLTDNSDEDNIETGLYLDYTATLGWTHHTFYFTPTVGGGRVKICFENLSASTSNIRIDAVQLEPDHTGKWGSFYTRGPRSDPMGEITMSPGLGNSILDNIEEFYEYTLLDWSNVGGTFYFAQEYSIEPVVTCGIQGEEADTLTTPIMFVSRPLQDVHGMYIGVEITLISASTPPEILDAKIAVKCICREVADEE